jgi:hypothetical protein
MTTSIGIAYSAVDNQGSRQSRGDNQGATIKGRQSKVDNQASNQAIKGQVSHFAFMSVCSG